MAIKIFKLKLGQKAPAPTSRHCQSFPWPETSWPTMYYIDKVTLAT